MVDDDPRAVRDRLELLERHVEPVAPRERARRLTSASPRRIAIRSIARQRDGDALPRLGALDLLVVHLHAADARLEPARLDPQHVAGAERPAPQRPGRDRPDPAAG